MAAYMVVMMDSAVVLGAIVVMTAGALAFVAHRLRQPVMIASVLTGIVVGPSIAGMMTVSAIDTAASAIIAFALFFAGLSLRWRNVRDVTAVSAMIAIVQIVTMTIVGAVFGLALNLSLTAAVLLGFALSFSSSVVSMKMLGDAHDADRLHGRIVAGVLAAQSVVAIVALLTIGALQSGDVPMIALGISLFKCVTVGVVLWTIARFVLPRVLRTDSFNDEFLVLGALSWCVALLIALSFFGFGVAVSAFLAGATLAGTGLQRVIEERIRVLRDIGVASFFIVLGALISIDHVAAFIVPAIILSLALVIVRFAVVHVVMRIMRQHVRTAFLTAAPLAQSGEWGVVIIGSAMIGGLVIPEVMTLVALVSMMTMAISVYSTTYAERLYSMLAKRYAIRAPEDDMHGHRGSDVVLLGYGRMGRALLPAVASSTDSFLVIDDDVAVVEGLLEEGRSVALGDCTHVETLALHHVDAAMLVISTIPNMEVNEALLDYCCTRQSTANVVVTAPSSAHAKRCYDLGATFVIVPSVFSGEAIATFIEGGKIGKTAWRTLAKRHHTGLHV